MNIGNYTLSFKEEVKIKYIYSKLQEQFPFVKFSYHTSIIGIGEPNKHLMVYFGIKEDVLFAKFKNQNSVPLDSEIYKFDQLIDATIYNFTHNDYTLKKCTHPLNEKKEFIVLNDTNVDKNKQYSLYTEILNHINDNITLNAFCSNRLNNVLQRHHIKTVGDIKKTSINNIILWHGFGTKCFEELLSVLAKIGEYSFDEINESQLYQSLSATDFGKADLIVYKELPLIKKLFTEQKIGEETFNDYSLGRTIYMLEKISDYDFSINCDFSDYEKIMSICAAKSEKLNMIYSEMIQYLFWLTDTHLNDREKRIFHNRIGLDNDAMTLAQIGVLENVTKERIRQILIKTKRKLKFRHPYKYDSIKSDYIKMKLLEELKDTSIEAFIIYLIDIDEIAFLRDFVCDVLLDIDYHSLNFNEYIYYKKQKESDIRQKKTYNDKIENLIYWADKKAYINNEDWTKYQKQRDVREHEESISGLLKYDEIEYQYESNMERKILLKFLQNQTFQQIKTQSLAIKIDISHTYYPDFICLTHDNHLLIVEVKPVQKMCERKNIIKFNVLKSYCDEHGYGYLIIDDRMMSFNHIATENKEFNNRILPLLPLNGSIGFANYKQIYVDTKAKITDLLWLVINKDVAYSLPFKLYTIK